MAPETAERELQLGEAQVSVSLSTVAQQKIPLRAAARAEWAFSSQARLPSPPRAGSGPALQCDSQQQLSSPADVLITGWKFAVLWVVGEYVGPGAARATDQ